MKDTLTISIVQFNPAWLDKSQNMRRIEKLILNSDFAKELILFPEMFLTGFSMDVSAIAEPMHGEMVNWMQKMAVNSNAVVLGSLPITENKRFYNRLIITTPENKLFYYDKRHLFRMGEEHLYYTGGTNKIIFKYHDWCISPLVCYDLRFPVWSRNKNLEYNILVYVANWPAPRNDAFLSLLKARAIENSSYVIGVNRVGTDGNNIAYLGNSVVFDPKGNVLAGMVENEETIINFQLSLSELNTYREKFPVHLDGDEFQVY